MKTQRTRTVFLLFSVLSISSVLPGRADTWVTVNPDGSVTRTTVTTNSGSAATAPARNYSPGQPLAVTPSRSRNNVSTYAYGVNPYPSTGYYPGQYSPYYPQPYYPPAPIYNQYYYPPAPVYSGPLYPTPYGNPMWITVIPLGTHYYPPAYAQPCQPCAVCGCYPCHCHGGISSSVSVGGGGVSITINGGRQRTSTRTTTTVSR